MEILETYKHIELTDEEITIAMIKAKAKKEKLLQYEKEQQRIAEGRRRLIETNWDKDIYSGYMLNYRAPKLFKFPFVLDAHNKPVFELLCLYFANDRGFISMAEGMGIKNPSLEKGLLIPGNFGVGKSCLMELFAQNKRQCFQMINTKDIAEDFRKSTDKEPFGFDKYTDPVQNFFNDIKVFEQPYSGICFDDLGTEDIKNNFGNKVNVMQDIIEMRYAKKHCGIMMHATTNLSAQGLTDYYGGRVASRLREITNFIQLPGVDRRK